MDTKHVGDLVIATKADAKRYAGIEEVTGYLYVSADFQAPVLATVGGYLDVRADFQAPVLATVTGYLYVSADFQAPVLATVGGVELTMHPIAVLGLHYSVTILDATMRIGCQEHTLEAWAAFDNRQIAAMDSGTAVRFWSENKAKIFDAARAAGRVFGDVKDAS